MKNPTVRCAPTAAGENPDPSPSQLLPLPHPHHWPQARHRSPLALSLAARRSMRACGPRSKRRPVAMPNRNPPSSPLAATEEKKDNYGNLQVPPHLQGCYSAEVDVPVSVAYTCYSDREAIANWMPFISSVKRCCAILSKGPFIMCSRSSRLSSSAVFVCSATIAIMAVNFSKVCLLC